MLRFLKFIYIECKAEALQYSVCAHFNLQSFRFKSAILSATQRSQHKFYIKMCMLFYFAICTKYPTQLNNLHTNMCVCVCV